MLITSFALIVTVLDSYTVYVRVKCNSEMHSGSPQLRSLILDSGLIPLLKNFLIARACSVERLISLSSIKLFPHG